MGHGACAIDPLTGVSVSRRWGVGVGGRWSLSLSFLLVAVVVGFVCVCAWVLLLL